MYSPNSQLKWLSKATFTFIYWKNTLNKVMKNKKKLLFSCKYQFILQMWVTTKYWWLTKIGLLVVCVCKLNTSLFHGVISIRISQNTSKVFLLFIGLDFKLVHVNCWISSHTLLYAFLNSVWEQKVLFPLVAAVWIMEHCDLARREFSVSITE